MRKVSTLKSTDVNLSISETTVLSSAARFRSSSAFFFAAACSASFFLRCSSSSGTWKLRFEVDLTLGICRSPSLHDHIFEGWRLCENRENVINPDSYFAKPPLQPPPKFLVVTSVSFPSIQ